MSRSAHETCFKWDRIYMDPVCECTVLFACRTATHSTLPSYKIMEICNSGILDLDWCHCISVDLCFSTPWTYSNLQIGAKDPHMQRLDSGYWSLPLQAEGLHSSFRHELKGNTFLHSLPFENNVKCKSFTLEIQLKTNKTCFSVVVLVTGQHVGTQKMFWACLKGQKSDKFLKQPFDKTEMCIDFSKWFLQEKLMCYPESRSYI